MHLLLETFRFDISHFRHPANLRTLYEWALYKKAKLILDIRYTTFFSGREQAGQTCIETFGRSLSERDSLSVQQDNFVVGQVQYILACAHGRYPAIYNTVEALTIVFVSKWTNMICRAWLSLTSHRLIRLLLLLDISGSYSTVHTVHFFLSIRPLCTIHCSMSQALLKRNFIEVIFWILNIFFLNNWGTVP